MPKIQNLKFHISFNFGADPPQGYTCILGANLVYTFRGDVVYTFGSILKKTKSQKAKG